jgi:prepilin-type N-terminal cleavage/methylation domain-containing protein
LVNRPPRSRALPYSAHCFASEAGFTLIELMVVVLIISVVCVLAIPSMSHEGYDRRAFEDATSVVELVREARSRAVARGSAQLLVLNANPTGSTGSFTLYESTTANYGEDAGSMTMSSSSCNAPTQWPGGTPSGTQQPVDRFEFSGGLEAQGSINMRVNDPITGKAISTNMYLCFTPAGRTWYFEGAAPPAAFTTPLASLCSATTAAAQSCVGAVTVDVIAGTFPVGSATGTTTSTSLIRTVWIPATGSTRITSQ